MIKFLKLWKFFLIIWFFRQWIQNFQTHVQKKNNTLAGKFYAQSGLRILNYNKLEKLLLEYHPVNLFYKEIEKFIQIYNQQNLNSEVINNLVEKLDLLHNNKLLSGVDKKSIQKLKRCTPS